MVLLYSNMQPVMGPRKVTLATPRLWRLDYATRGRRVCYTVGPDASAHDVPPTPPKQDAGPLTAIKEVFYPFSDSRASARFLALTLGGMLCSIATLIHDSYLPLFMREELSLSNSSIGGIQAISQLLCQLSKGFSGVMGDLLKSQVKILLFGTVLTALCKPMFAGSSFIFATFGATACLWWITAGKLIDRFSKGLRDAPSKALITEIARDVGESSDSAFSVRQSVATMGSLAGSAIASAAFVLTGQSYVLTFAIAGIPPVLALLWLSAAFGEEIRAKSAPNSAAEQDSKRLDRAERGPVMPASLASYQDGITGSFSPDAQQPAPGLFEKARILASAFKPAYWQALAVVALLYFGRFDFTFVTLRAKTCLVPKSMLPILASATMLATTLSALTVGRYAKGKGVAVRNNILLAGFVMLIIANGFLGLPFSANMLGMFAACTFIGLHMGLTQGLTLSMVSSYMPKGELPGFGKVSGTAWSFTDLFLGVILALSNGLAGVLTDMTEAKMLGNVGCFGGGACAAILASCALLLFSWFGELGKDLTVASAKKG